MLGFFKNLFGKSDDKQPAPAPAAAPAAPPSKSAAPAGAQPAPAKPASPAAPVSVETTALHLEAIVASFPAELKGSVKSDPGGKVMVQVSTQTILEQMPSGKVKVTFGSLRKSAPPGVFSDDASLDQTSVILPLGEVRASIDPALLKRRASQKMVAVPDDVTGLFHKGEMPTAPPTTHAPTSPAPAAPQPTTVKPNAPTAETATSKGPAPTPAPPAPPAPPPAPKPPASPSAIAISPALREMMTSASAPPKPPAPKPPTPPPPAVPKPPAPSPSTTVPKPPAPAAPPTAPKPPTPAPPAVPAAPTADVGELNIPLAEVSKGWPEAVQAELKSLKPDSTLSLPAADLGTAVRSGRIVFTWKQLRGWIRPAPITASSPEDAAALTLPSAVIVPLFMALSQPAKAQRKANFDENIPDMFAPGSKKVPAPPAPPTAADPTPVPPPPAPAAPPPPPAPPITPNQSVQKLCGLPGVAGAVLVSQDGFVVAQQLPPPIKAETVAAFLPQIFGRLSQNSKEMNLGELSVLTFVVDNVTWQLSKTGNLFLAVVARAGESLPSAQINPIAAEIGRQNKQ